MFSLIIPYHNRARFLPRTLHSLLNCSVKPMQTILVDNGSTDDSANICRTFAAEHPELNILLLEEKKNGACAARNKGLTAVKTEWVYFFDSDDELSPDYFEHVTHCLKDNSKLSLDMVACQTVRVFADGMCKPRDVQYSSSVIDQILSGQLSTQAMFLRTAFLRDIGGWNEELLRWNDWELGIRVFLHNPRMAWLKNKAYHRVYEHSDSITGDDFSSSASSLLRALCVASTLSSQKRYLFALACRCHILAGFFLREHNIVYAREAGAVSAHILKQINSKKATFFANALKRYVSIGGRGAWYFALKTAHMLHFS